jgi:hypothetical protein
VSEAYADAGITPAMSDADFRLTCDGCSTTQRLDEMPLSEVAGVTIYACRKCNRSLVGVKPYNETAEPREMSGFRLRSNVVGSKVDVLNRPPGKAGDVVLPATPAFFE